MKAFLFLKEKLVLAPIVVALDWNLSFELMCDVSDYTIRAVQVRRGKEHFRLSIMRAGL